MEQNPQALFSWKAPLRAYKKRGKNVLRFYIALCLLVSLIVFFFGDRILLIPVFSLFFLFYVLTITPPPEIENKISLFGIETVGITLRWEILSHFYLTKKFGFDVLVLVTHSPYSYHSYLIIPNEEIKKKLIEILSQHIMFLEKPQKTFVDKMVDWFSSLIPDDEEEVHTASSLLQKQAPASL